MVRSTAVNSAIIIGICVLIIALPVTVLTLVFKSAKEDTVDEPVSQFQPVLENPSCNLKPSDCTDNNIDLRNCVCLISHKTPDPKDLSTPVSCIITSCQVDEVFHQDDCLC